MAEVKPEEKLRLVRDEQSKGRLVAMSGDGTNDAPPSPRRTSVSLCIRHCHGGHASVMAAGKGLERGELQVTGEFFAGGQRRCSQHRA